MDTPPLPADGDLFWQERRTCFRTTLRPDGSPHTTPVGVAYDPETRIARVITDGDNKNIRAALAVRAEARVNVSQAEGRRWSTLEGTAVIKDDPSAVADAERYKPPRVNPNRVVIEITVTRALGPTKPSGW